MINLILTKDKDRVRREYRGRVFVVVGFLVMSIVIIFVVGLGSLSTVVHFRKVSIESSLELARKTGGVAQFDELEKEFKGIEEKIKILNTDRDTVMPVSDVWLRMVEKRRQGIAWRGLFYSRNQEEGGVDLVLDGGAGTRQQFLNFINVLKEDPLLTNIEYPISNLINERDIDYLIALKINGGKEKIENAKTE